MNDLSQAIEQFIAEWQRIHDDYMQRQFPNNPNPRIEVRYGRKYAKVVQDHSVQAFISLDVLNAGDIFKPAGWQKPAPHARGNVFSKQGGIEALSTGGLPHVRYLK